MGSNNLEMHGWTAECCESEVPVRGYYFYGSVAEFGGIDVHHVGAAAEGGDVYVRHC